MILKLLNGYERFIISQLDQKSILYQVEISEKAAKYKADFIAGLEMPKKAFDEVIRQFKEFHDDQDTPRE